MFIVGVCAVAGGGKTTFSERLRDMHGFSFASFASPLKDDCAERYGFDRGALDFDEAARALGYESSFAYKEEYVPDLDMTRRQALILRATEARAADPDIYVNLLIRKLEAGGKYVIGDVRFRNEVAAMRTAGGVLVRLYRPSREDVVTSAGAHESETEWKTIEPDFAFTPGEGIPLVQQAADDFVATLRATGRI